jgi:Homeodomain-like domain
MAMKKYIVRLSAKERRILRGIVRKFKGAPTKVRRAQILLKADVDGSNWTDAEIADAFGCRIRTVENVRERLVTLGFEAALHKKQPSVPPRAKVLDGEQEAKIIALRLGKPPKGFANWSLRLLTERVVELGIVERVSHETLRKTLKKTA